MYNILLEALHLAAANGQEAVVQARLCVQLQTQEVNVVMFPLSSYHRRPLQLVQLNGKKQRTLSYVLFGLIIQAHHWTALHVADVQMGPGRHIRSQASGSTMPNEDQSTSYSRLSPRDTTSAGSVRPPQVFLGGTAHPTGPLPIAQHVTPARHC